MDLTDEQDQIINHPDGYHGKVLSVAGSGKTTTMAHRIRHVLESRGVSPRQIQVLMFNRDARNQFVEKMTEIGIDDRKRPRVNTFHSYAYGLLKGQGFQQWFGETEELAHLALVRSVEKARRQFALDEDDLDVDEAGQAISLWKGGLIPPSRAGYSGEFGEAYAAIYKEYEAERLNSNAITFDDFVPLVVAQLNGDPGIRQRLTNELRYIIVDEYQDVNLGQEKLIECLSRGGADLMVVGDDDQTIYEWRGARSEYILGEFAAIFDNKPHITYKLTNSFRFGYVIAQSSYNVILHNTKRLDKRLLASSPSEESFISMVTDGESAGRDASTALADEALSLVKDKGVLPSDIRVLARTYAQLNPLSTEFLLQKIPFKVMGRSSFLQAGECQALLDYLRVASALDQVPSNDTGRRLRNIANKPRRYLPRPGIERMLEDSRRKKVSLGDALHETSLDSTRFSNPRQQDLMKELASFLRQLNRKMQAEDGSSQAGTLLKWVDEKVGFQQHYRDYYGNGESSLVRIETLQFFMKYADMVEMQWQDFIRHTDNADTTLGLPENQWIKMITIHSAKGLEFDYVIIPSCEEGYIPVIGTNDDPTFDKQDPNRVPKTAEWIENERRLFYVGMTRARKGLYIGAPAVKARREKTGANDEARICYSELQQSESPLASRFLEEMELAPTQAVATEMIRAARGDESSRLVEVCQSLSAFHNIVGTVKSYANRLPGAIRDRLARVELSSAERPFAYKQEYRTPNNRGASQSGYPDSRGSRVSIWDHIDFR